MELFSTEPHLHDDHTQLNIHVQPYSKESQIPVHSGAMVPYGKNSVLYLGGITTSNLYSDNIFQFIGDEKRWKMLEKVTLQIGHDVQLIAIYTVFNMYLHRGYPE